MFGMGFVKDGCFPECNPKEMDWTIQSESLGLDGLPVRPVHVWPPANSAGGEIYGTMHGCNITRISHHPVHA